MAKKRYLLISLMALSLSLVSGPDRCSEKIGAALFFADAVAADKQIPTPAVRAPELKLDAGIEEIPDWLVRWELARALSHMKRYDEALDEYGKLLKARPDLVEARIETANILYWQGKVKEALRELEKLPFRDLPDISRLLMAELYRSLKQYERSVSIYRDHLSKQPDDQSTRLKLAEALSWMKDYPASLKEYEIILKARPSDIHVRRKYAMVLSWAGRHADAARELRTTLK
jgi:tetratricopeptide (TPR) repeat protein